METYFLCAWKEAYVKLFPSYSAKNVLSSEAMWYTSFPEHLPPIFCHCSGVLAFSATKAHTHTHTERQTVNVAQSTIAVLHAQSFPTSGRNKHGSRKYLCGVQSDDVITKYLQRVTYKNFETTEYRCLLNGKFFKRISQPKISICCDHEPVRGCSNWILDTVYVYHVMHSLYIILVLYSQ